MPEQGLGQRIQARVTGPAGESIQADMAAGADARSQLNREGYGRGIDRMQQDLDLAGTGTEFIGDHPDFGKDMGPGAPHPASRMAPHPDADKAMGPGAPHPASRMAIEKTRTEELLSKGLIDVPGATEEQAKSVREEKERNSKQKSEGRKQFHRNARASTKGGLQTTFKKGDEAVAASNRVPIFALSRDNKPFKRLASTNFMSHNNLGIGRHSVQEYAAWEDAWSKAHGGVPPGADAKREWVYAQLINYWRAITSGTMRDSMGRARGGGTTAYDRYLQGRRDVEGNWASEDRIATPHISYERLLDAAEMYVTQMDWGRGGNARTIATTMMGKLREKIDQYRTDPSSPAWKGHFDQKRLDAGSASTLDAGGIDIIDAHIMKMIKEGGKLGPGFGESVDRAVTRGYRGIQAAKLAGGQGIRSILGEQTDTERRDVFGGGHWLQGDETIWDKAAAMRLIRGQDARMNAYNRTPFGTELADRTTDTGFAPFTYKGLPTGEQETDIAKGEWEAQRPPQNWAADLLDVAFAKERDGTPVLGTTAKSPAGIIDWIKTITKGMPLPEGETVHPLVRQLAEEINNRAGRSDLGISQAEADEATDQVESRQAHDVLEQSEAGLPEGFIEDPMGQLVSEDAPWEGPARVTEEGRTLAPGEEGYEDARKGAVEAGMGAPSAKKPVLPVDRLQKASPEQARAAETQANKRGAAAAGADHATKTSIANVARIISEAEDEYDKRRGEGAYAGVKREKGTASFAMTSSEITNNIVTNEIKASMKAFEDDEFVLEAAKYLSQGLIAMGDGFKKMSGGLVGLQGPSQVPNAIISALEETGAAKQSALMRLSVFGMTGYLFPEGTSSASMQAQMPMLQHSRSLEQKTKEFLMSHDRLTFESWAKHQSDVTGMKLTEANRAELRRQWDLDYDLKVQKQDWDHAKDIMAANAGSMGNIAMDRLEVETIEGLLTNIDLGRHVLGEKPKYNTGWFKNWWEVAGNYLGWGDPDWHHFKQLVTTQLNTYVNKLTGKQLSKHEVSRLKGAVPQISDNDAIFTAKAKTFIKIQEAIFARKLKIYALNGHNTSSFEGQMPMDWRIKGVGDRSGSVAEFRQWLSQNPQMQSKVQILTGPQGKPFRRGEDYLGDIFIDYIDPVTQRYIGPEAGTESEPQFRNLPIGPVGYTDRWYQGPLRGPVPRAGVQTGIRALTPRRP